MSDIVERLRTKQHLVITQDEAADEIERLLSLLKEAGDALEPIAQRWIDPLSIAREHWQRASTVLSKIKGEA